MLDLPSWYVCMYVWVWMNRLTRSPYSVLLTPDALKKIVMDVAHAGFAGGHSGKNRTVDRLELAYWWPDIHYDVETFISVSVVRNFQVESPSLLLFRVYLYVRSPILESTWIFLAPCVVDLLQGRSI